MLSAAIVLDYVWLHFCSLFPEAAEMKPAYGSEATAKVKINSAGLTFLLKKLTFPEEIFWVMWEDKKIPVLTAGNKESLFTEQEKGLLIQPDIIASAFYFLSGWQEYYSQKRDRFGRFPFSESLQFKHDFVALPVVNYYFDILKTALEKAYGTRLKKAEENNSFTTFLSHDVDRLESAWKVEGIKQLKQGKILSTGSLVLQKLSGSDHWHNLKTVANTVKKYGAVSTFFWLAQPGKYQGHPNADYDITQPKYQSLLRELAKEGFENGIHGSFGTSTAQDQLKSEISRLQLPVKGNRYHYLCFDPAITAQTLTNAGLQYDSTLGFAEHFGFRNGYCFPFRLFDFSTSKPYPFLEIPLHLMDATLWHPNYLQLAPENVIPTLLPMLTEIKKFGGVFGLLWHNENFSDLNEHNGLAVFESIMQQLQTMGTTFRTGTQLCETYQARLDRCV
jgi:hypothetical protein